MENIYIKIDEIPTNLATAYFKDTDLVPIESLIIQFDNLYYDYEKLKEDYENLIEDIRDNYKFIGTREAIGYDERTW